MTSQWRHHLFDFLSNLYTNLPRVIYLSDIPTFILIEHKRAEIQSREVNRELWRKKWVSRHCDHDLWPKVHNFKLDLSQCVNQPFNENCVQIGNALGWNFVHKKTVDTQTHTHTLTHTHTHTQTNCSENITLPRFRGGVKIVRLVPLLSYLQTGRQAKVKQCPFTFNKGVIILRYSVSTH